MGPLDNEDEDHPPRVFHMFLNGAEVNNNPELLMLIHMLMGKLMAQPDWDDDPQLSDIAPVSVQNEMMRLEVLDEQVSGDQFPQALELIMNAYRKQQND